MSLEILGLSPQILQATKDRGYTQATPIQQKLIPEILAGRDIIAGANTGTGKTAGFVLPILQYIYSNKQNNTQAIIIAPTRELAKQLYMHVQEYAKYLNISIASICGGANINTQKQALNNNPNIVVATSGRLLQHIKDKSITLAKVKYLVLDEADTILDMGFANEITQIVSKLPTKKQTILISATLSPSLKRLANEILHRAKLIEVDKLGVLSPDISQVVYPVKSELKAELLSYLIGSNNYSQVLVFVRKKETSTQVAKELNASGLKTELINGDKKSGARTKALNAFKEHKARVLVATDIVARGLDIDSLPVVINYDIPHAIGDYIHRIGRTGRAGKSGLAITLISPKEEIALRDVEQLTGKAIKRIELDEYKPLKEDILQRKNTKKSVKKKRIDGAFGNKKNKKLQPTKKKRKTTKRDWNR